MTGVEVRVRAVDMRRMARDDLNAVARAATTSVRRAAFGTVRDIQKQLRRSMRVGQRKSGSPLDSLVRADVDPNRGNRLDPRGRVYSKARYRRRSGIVDLLVVFDEGATITGRGGRWLAIPTEFAPLKSGRGGTRRASPRESGRQLAFIPVGRSKGILIDPRTKRPLYVLLRQVRLRKRIDIDSIFQRRSGRLLDQFFRTLEQEDRKLEARYGAIRTDGRAI